MNMKNIYFALVFLPNLLFSQKEQKESSYGERFLQNCVVHSNNTLQYRVTTGTVDLNQYFSGGVEITPFDFLQAEHAINYDFPYWIEDQIVGFKVPIEGIVRKKISGIEFGKSLTVGTPYFSLRLNFASSGRLEEPSPFMQPKIIGPLTKQLLNGSDQKFIRNLSKNAVQSLANQQSIVRGRVDIIFEMNLKNAVHPNLKQKDKIWNSNIYPYYVYKSVDASNRIGVIESFDSKESIDQKIDNMQLGTLGGYTKEIGEVLVNYINNKVFLPAGYPIYHGFGCRAETGIKFKKYFKLNATVDYNVLYNKAKGVNPLKSTAFQIGLQVGNF